MKIKKNTLLNKQWIEEKIKGENKDVPWNKQKMETHPQTYKILQKYF